MSATALIAANPSTLLGQSATPPAAARQPPRAEIKPIDASSPIVGVGGDRHGFLAIRDDAPPSAGPGLMPGPGPTPADAGPIWRLYHLPASADPGSVFSAGGRHLTEIPGAWTVAGDALILAFTERDTTQDAPAIRVRRLTVLTGAPLGMYAYEPEGRFEALAPIEDQDAAISAASVRDAAFLLTQRATMGGAPGEALALRRLDRASWTSAALPPSGQTPLTSGATARLFRWGDGLGFRVNRTGAPPELWRLPGDKALGNDVSPGDWQRVSAPIEPEDRLFGTPTQLLAVARDDASDAFVVSAVREGFRARIASIKAPADAAILPLGELAVFAWTDSQANGRLRITALDPSTGRIAFNDFAQTASPVSQRDVQLILLLAGAALLTALLFALRPEDREAQVALPAGRALAPPMRRLAAAALDFAPAVAIASLVWGAPFTHALGLPSGNGASAPIGPPLTALAIWLAHSAAGEWRFGRTIGKALLRCRTVRVADGQRPNLRQALLRNAVKALAPPLAAMLLIERWRRHPGDLLAGTIVILDAETVDSDEASTVRRAERERDAHADSTAHGP